MPPPMLIAPALAQAMRARGVVVSPPEAFVVGRASVPHAVRLCLGAPRTRDDLDRALNSVGEALRGAREAGTAML